MMESAEPVQWIQDGLCGFSRLVDLVDFSVSLLDPVEPVVLDRLCSPGPCPGGPMLMYALP